LCVLARRTSNTTVSVYSPAAFDQFLINSQPKFHLDCSPVGALEQFGVNRAAVTNYALDFFIIRLLSAVIAASRRMLLSCKIDLSFHAANDYGVSFFLDIH